MPQNEDEAALVKALMSSPFRGWELTRKIGEGASAWVFLAERGDGFVGPPTERRALKIFKPWLTERYAESVQEARIQRQLALKGVKHPHLIEVLDGGRDGENGYFFLFMGYLDQPTLSKVIGRVPVERIAPLMAQVASAAKFLEGYGFVHRDIKPDNIVIDDRFRSATLLDFGVLLPLEGSTLTDHHSDRQTFLGTVRWSPPEFLKRIEEPEAEGYRAITFYQLGAVLHDLLVGERMFSGIKDEPRASLIEAVLNAPPDFSRVKAGAIPELVDLAKRCLAKEPRDRLESVTWDSFACRRMRRRPLVVLLYTGGTIGARVAPDSSHVRDLRPIIDPADPFLKMFREKIKRDYSLFCGPSSPMPFDLEWEVLPPERQLLSENATPETWRSLAETVHRICSKHIPSSAEEDSASAEELINSGGRLPGVGTPIQEEGGSYLAGIVILHGTDTLAYSAAALSVMFRNLPCPVVLTGSNQPPRIEDVRERDPITNQSDAWKNIRRSLFFLQAFGHRFTEVFVCFGDTVHTAINIRKTSAHRQPFLRQWDDVTLQEPYFYRNGGTQRDYMFRIIEDLYCNNFYPIREHLNYGVLLDERKVNSFRHFRSSPLHAYQPFKIFPLSGRVELTSVSPVFFKGPDCGEELRRLSGRLELFDVLVLEGFDSGTFPSEPDHPFTALLRRLMRQAIPIVLVTRDGLLPTREPYKMQKIDDYKLPILRLFGVIAETAAPLISVVRASIPDEVWVTNETDWYEVLLRRHTLLEEALRHRQVEYPGILASLLGNIVDEVEQLSRVGEGIERERSQYDLVVERLFSTADSPLSARLVGRRSFRGRRSLQGEEERKFDSTRSVLMRGHFLWLLREFVRPFEMAGCGPDGLGVLNEIGYIWGQQMFERLKAPDREGGTRLFFEMSGERQKTMVERVRAKVLRLSRLLRRHGIADIEATLQIDTASSANGRQHSRVRLLVSSARYSFISRRDELYAVKDYGDEERGFFDALRGGAELTLYDGECSGYLEGRFDDLFQNGPGTQMSALDWFLLGSCKAAICSILVELRFDRWVARCSSDYRNNISVLRQSVSSKIISSGETGWSMEFIYEARSES